MKKQAKKVEAPKKVLVLRTVNEKREAHGGFVWPEKGPVEAPDWDPVVACGNGLHGWLRGEGCAESGNLTPTNLDKRLWQVVEVVESDIVQLDGKVKYPRGVVLYTGERFEAIKRIQEAYPGAAVIGGVQTAGYSGTATAGYSGTATAGIYGKATAGDSGTATAGYSGTATAGSYGKATAGDSGTATAGYSGTATAGRYGKATAGEKGIIVIRYFDDQAKRYRLAVGYPGEDGIEAGKKYKLDSEHKFVEVP